MRQIKTFSDERLLYNCVHCGRDTGTRDHSPSKVFLDEPYPENLPVVPSCQDCNQSFSKDEEYVACLLECTLQDAASAENVKREKIAKILSEKPALAIRIFSARKRAGFVPEEDRVNNVILKLARSHAAFELSEPQLEKPTLIKVRPLLLMNEQQSTEFEGVPEISVFPEIGSRAFQRGLLGTELYNDWIIVQEDRYRYFTAHSNVGLVVRIVFSEYLACEVVWN